MQLAEDDVARAGRLADLLRITLCARAAQDRSVAHNRVTGFSKFGSNNVVDGIGDPIYGRVSRIMANRETATIGFRAAHNNGSRRCGRAAVYAIGAMNS